MRDYVEFDIIKMSINFNLKKKILPNLEINRTVSSLRDLNSKILTVLR